MQLNSKIMHGAAYYPEQWPRDVWDRDIAAMKELGINVVRMAEFSWCYLEPEEDVFHIDLYDEIIEKLGKNGIYTVLGTPTATPPRWLTVKYPDSLYVDRNMVKANHGSREHVCFHSPDYVRRSEIIVRKMAEHYGKNPYVIAWQIHNEYNCPPVNECVCDNCARAWQKWLRAKYGTIDNMNEKWGSGIWSTRYGSFEEVLPPRPTPNGHCSSIVTNYTRFTFDGVAEFNKMQADILHEYTDAPVTHNTNRVFHIDQETIFEPLDFVSFDDYSLDDNWQECNFSQELCRGLKPDVPFWEMETASSYCANIMWGTDAHKRGFVKAEAASAFFAGATGFCYWLFHQHRSGTEMPQSHLVTVWGAISRTAVNVRDVSEEIKELESFLLSTSPARAQVALLYSDKARAFCDHEKNRDIDYHDDIFALYKELIACSCYRDIVYEGSDFSPYKLIFVPYVMHVSKELREKLVAAAKAGATVVLGPYTGWRTDDHTYETEAAFGELEALFGERVEDVAHFRGQDATYELFGKEAPLTCIGAVTKRGTGVIHGGYYDGMSMLTEAPCGKGKICFVGTKLPPVLLHEYVEHMLSEHVERGLQAEDGVILFERKGGEKRYDCLVNMTGEEKRVSVVKGSRKVFGGESGTSFVLPPYGNLILER